MFFSPKISVGLYLAFIPVVVGLNIKYCSNLNTAETSINSTQFQSNGLCYQFCIDDFAFAINQGYDCWCSNIAPGVTTSITDCSLRCPGYPSDNCGGDGLFAYQSLPMAPSGTAGGPSSTSSSSSEDPTTVAPPVPTPVTIFKVQTVTEPIASSSIVASIASTSTSTSTSTSPTPSRSPPPSPASNPTSSEATSDKATSSATWTPTPVTSLETVTGQVRTVTVTPTVPPNSESLDGTEKSENRGGIGTGGAVGLAIGLIAATAIICLAVYFCLKKRRRHAELLAAENDSISGSAGLGGPIPSRTMSENSRFVLGTDGRNVVEAWEPHQTKSTPRVSSRLIPIDQRLDPFQSLYLHDSKSGESVIQDDRDYSRRVQPSLPILRMTNPDPLKK